MVSRQTHRCSPVVRITVSKELKVSCEIELKWVERMEDINNDAPNVVQLEREEDDEPLDTDDELEREEREILLLEQQLLELEEGLGTGSDDGDGAQQHIADTDLHVEGNDGGADDSSDVVVDDQSEGEPEEVPNVVQLERDDDVRSETIDEGTTELDETANIEQVEEDNVDTTVAAHASDDEEMYEAPNVVQLERDDDVRSETMDEGNNELDETASIEQVQEDNVDTTVAAHASDDEDMYEAPNVVQLERDDQVSPQPTSSGEDFEGEANEGGIDSNGEDEDTYHDSEQHERQQTVDLDFDSPTNNDAVQDTDDEQEEQERDARTQKDTRSDDGEGEQQHIPDTEMYDESKSTTSESEVAASRPYSPASGASDDYDSDGSRRVKWIPDSDLATTHTKGSNPRVGLSFKDREHRQVCGRVQELGTAQFAQSIMKRLTQRESHAHSMQHERVLWVIGDVNKNAHNGAAQGILKAVLHTGCLLVQSCKRPPNLFANSFTRAADDRTVCILPQAVEPSRVTHALHVVLEGDERDFEMYVDVAFSNLFIGVHVCMYEFIYVCGSEVS
jgi:hypothetical protein